jgi:hypothetical protein
VKNGLRRVGANPGAKHRKHDELGVENPDEESFLDSWARAGDIGKEVP